MRAFVAIDVPEPLRRALAAVARDLRGVRPVRPDGIHLTLRFLGEVDEARVPALVDVLRASAGPALRLRIAGGGAFPSPERPRVLWAGVQGDVARLTELVARIEAALRAAGFPPEQRAYAPHVTLGRGLGRVAPSELRRLFDLGDLGGIEAREIVLYRSELRPEGARHEVVARVPLEEAA